MYVYSRVAQFEGVPVDSVLVVLSVGFQGQEGLGLHPSHQEIFIQSIGLVENGHGSVL